MQLTLSRAFCNFLYEAVDLENTPKLPKEGRAFTLEQLFLTAQERFDTLVRLREEVAAERKLQDELLLTIAYLRRKAHELERRMEIQDDRHPLERLREAEAQRPRPDGACHPKRPSARPRRHAVP